MLSDKCASTGVWVIIPAAGIGSRMQSVIPKQYLTIHSKTVLEHTISRFSVFDSIAGILVVLGENDPYWSDVESSLSDLGISSPFLQLTTGGLERADTVVNGLNFLGNELGISQEQWVMVHDAARPCVRNKDLLRLLEIRDSDYAGGILATPVKDTMKRAASGNHLISHTESREKLWHALTPQLFRLGALSNAIESANLAGRELTDEASAMEFVGASVALVEGASDNIKLTTPSDLPLIEFLLQQRDVNADV